MNAVITNTITNFIHAGFLFAYLLAAFLYWRKNDPRFTTLILLFFLLAFVLKVLGVIAHAYHDISYINIIWISIGVGALLLNIFLLYAIDMPKLIRLMTCLILLLFACFYFINLMFLLIAIPAGLTYLIAAYYSQKQTRIAFICILGSNIVWILARQITGIMLKGHIPLAIRYDNDLYHILLIISTFILYKSIIKGHWRYPK